MKTLTLRLSDLEAEALERLAYVKGTSKNRLIANLIVNEYSKCDSWSDIIEGEIVSMSMLKDWAIGVDETLPENPTKEEIVQALRTINYVLEKATYLEDDESTLLESFKDDLMETYRDL